MQGHRIERIDLMRRKLKEEFGSAKTDISYDTFIAKYCLETGVSRRTAMEYMDLLNDAGEIKVDKGYMTNVLTGVSDRRIRSP